jgi:1-acyl-sn-glycerol-3-phosphate acyltransferase
MNSFSVKNITNRCFLCVSALSRKLGKLIGAAGTKIYARVEVEGYENLNEGKTYIIVANHTSHLDSIALLYGLSDHPLIFLAANDYFFDSPWRQFFYTAFVPILPIHREGIHISDFKNVLHYLHDKHSVVIYPEGTRSKTGEMSEFKPGAALLSMQADVPVVPIYVRGTYELWPKGRFFPKPGKVHIKIGMPISPPPHKHNHSEILAALTAEYEKAVKDLKPTT